MLELKPTKPSFCLMQKYDFEQGNICNHYYEELNYKLYLDMPGLLDYRGVISRSYIISQFFNIKKKRG